MRQRLTLKQVSERVGVTLGVVNHWESKRTQVPSELVPDIANALGVTICDLYGVDEGHQQPQSDLTAAERQALDNIARELVKLRSARTERALGRSTAVAMRAMLRDWRDLPAEIQEELLAAADEIREGRGE